MDILKTAIDTIISSETIEMVLLFVLIMILEKTMSKKSFMTNMVSSLKSAVGDYRISAMMLPAILGFLPSAGGALFSAPMLNEVCEGHSVDCEKKSFINFWYRHIWEYCFPLYPGLILASSILSLPTSVIVTNLFPYTILNILIGLPFVYFGLSGETNNKRKIDKKSMIEFLKNFLPILLVIFGVFLFKIDTPFAVIISIFTIIIWKKIKYREFFDIAKESFSPNIIFTILGILYFKNMIVKTGLVDSLPVILGALNIKSIYIVMLLPFITGVLTGISSAFVGIAFPIIASIYPILDMKLVALAYVSGMAGVMITPMHLCLTLTLEYFGASFNKVVPKLLLGQSMIVIIAFFTQYIL